MHWNGDFCKQSQCNYVHTDEDYNTNLQGKKFRYRKYKYIQGQTVTEWDKQGYTGTDKDRQGNEGIDSDRQGQAGTSRDIRAGVHKNVNCLRDFFSSKKQSKKSA